MILTKVMTLLSSCVLVFSLSACVHSGSCECTGDEVETCDCANESAAKEHKDHKHDHGPDCGHKAEAHSGHTDYEHDGHHHHKKGDQWKECDGPEHKKKS